jgi:hypothetical protein
MYSRATPYIIDFILLVWERWSEFSGNFFSWQCKNQIVLIILSLGKPYKNNLFNNLFL